MTARKTYRAKWLLPDPWTVLENGHVTVAGGVIEAVGSGRPPKDTPVLDLGPGVLSSAFVNAHTHLELSALKGMLPFDTGFRLWTAELVRKRADLTESLLLEAAGEAATRMVDAGVGAVADISTLGLTQDLLQGARLGGVFFREYLGSSLPENPHLEASPPLSSSLAAHAPHTTDPSLIHAIRQATFSKGLPMSIHLSESEDEVLFIQSARGDWADFLSDRGIDFSGWPLPAASPVRYLERLNALGAGTLAVHLLYCSREDMQILRESGASICCCPRSNLLLHGKLPDLPGFLAFGFTPCLGTDSLASCPSLSILDEMAFIFQHYDSISPADIIAMGTVYGAAALGMERRYGRLAPGFSAPPFYSAIEVDAPRDVPMALVCCGNTELYDTDGKPEP